MSLSTRWLRALPAASLLAVLAVGCGYGHYDRDHDYYYDDDGEGPYCGEPEEESGVDVDEALDIEPGAGAGAFIEYESGGIYHITTSCDVGEGDCLWDIVVTPLDAPISSLTPFSLERDDSLSIIDAGNSVHLVTYTGRDLDGFTLRTEPGAAIRFDAWLDNGCANRYLFWFGDGALHSGAPSNPIVLVPSGS